MLLTSPQMTTCICVFDSSDSTPGVPVRVHNVITSPQMTTCICVFDSSDSTPGVPVRVHNVTNKSTNDHMYLCL